MANLDLLYILNRQYETIGLIDQYYSLIWTTRFRGEGEFEIELPPSTDALYLLQMGNYVQDPNDTETLMIVQDITIETDFEDGSRLKVKGYSLESILRNHIVQKPYVSEDKVDYISFIRQVLTDNLVSPTNEAQKIPGLVIDQKSISSPVPNLETTLALAVDGDNIYELVDEAAEYLDLGWRIRPLYSTKGMRFEFYLGTDRSYAQLINPWVVFSPSYDNLISSNYFTSLENYANVAYVKSPEGGTWEQDESGEITPLADIEDGGGGSGGGGGGTSYPIKISRGQYYITVFESAEEPSGFDRHAIFLDYSSEFQWYDEENNKVLTEAEMTELLRAKALVELGQHKKTEAFDGEVETLRQFVYGVDFEIGDICQMKNEYGRECAIRVSEVVQSVDEGGYSLVPTFTNVDWHS